VCVREQQQVGGCQCCAFRIENLTLWLFRSSYNMKNWLAAGALHAAAAAGWRLRAAGERTCMVFSFPFTTVGATAAQYSVACAGAAAGARMCAAGGWGPVMCVLINSTLWLFRSSYNRKGWLHERYQQQQQAGVYPCGRYAGVYDVSHCDWCLALFKVQCCWCCRHR
jgi:hypothetical protein